MRVLIVHPHMMSYSGAELVVTKLATYLTKKGVENVILTLSKPPESMTKAHEELRFIVPSKTYIYKIRTTNFFETIGLIDEIIALRAYVRLHKRNFDVVNVHNFPATWSTFPARKPCVWMCNEPPDLWANPNPSAPLKILRNTGLFLDKLIVNQAINIICVADEFNAQRVSKRYGRESTIVPYGIDYEFFSHGDEKEDIEKFDLHNSFVLLQVGRVCPPKNQFESVKAVKRLRRYIPKIKLVLAGPTVAPYEEMLRKYISAKGCERNVVFTGYLPREIIRDLYHACDVVLSPTKEQGGWLAPFEALCASKPVVVSPSLSSASIIKKEKIGLVTHDFAGAIWDIYKNPKLYHDMTLRGKRWIAENLTWNKFCEAMLAAFESAFDMS